MFHAHNNHVDRDRSEWRDEVFFSSVRCYTKDANEIGLRWVFFARSEILRHELGTYIYENVSVLKVIYFFVNKLQNKSM